MNCREAEAETGRVVRRLLQESRQEMVVPWSIVIVVEMVRRGQIQGILRRYSGQSFLTDWLHQVMDQYQPLAC